MRRIAPLTRSSTSRQRSTCYQIDTCSLGKISMKRNLWYRTIRRHTILLYVAGRSCWRGRKISDSLTDRISFRSAALVLTLAVLVSLPCFSQDWIRTGTGLGVEKVRLAVPDFKAVSADSQTAPLLKVFNDTLWGDLDNAGIFDL